MSKNSPSAGVCQYGTGTQKQTHSTAAGMTNGVATPFGQPAGRSAKPSQAAPRHGVHGQRLSGGGGKGATGYPPGYTSR